QARAPPPHHAKTGRAGGPRGLSLRDTCRISKRPSRCSGMQLEANDLSLRAYSDCLSRSDINGGIQIQVPGGLPVPISDIVGVVGMRASNREQLSAVLGIESNRRKIGLRANSRSAPGQPAIFCVREGDSFPLRILVIAASDYSVSW